MLTILMSSETSFDVWDMNITQIKLIDVGHISEGTKYIYRKLENIRV